MIDHQANDPMCMELGCAANCTFMVHDTNFIFIFFSLVVLMSTCMVCGMLNDPLELKLLLASGVCVC